MSSLALLHPFFLALLPLLPLQARIGGKGTVRRKQAVASKPASADDKKLAATAKRLGCNTIPGIEEVTIIKNDGSSVQFHNPKLQAAIQSNTFVVTGHPENKSQSETMAAFGGGGMGGMGAGGGMGAAGMAQLMQMLQGAGGAGGDAASMKQLQELLAKAGPGGLAQLLGAMGGPGGPGGAGGEEGDDIPELEADAVEEASK